MRDKSVNYIPDSFENVVSCVVNADPKALLRSAILKSIDGLRDPNLDNVLAEIWEDDALQEFTEPEMEKEIASCLKVKKNPRKEQSKEKDTEEVRMLRSRLRSARKTIYFLCGLLLGDTDD